MAPSVTERAKAWLTMSGIARILIVLYCAGIGLGIFPGTGVRQIFLPFMPYTVASLMSSVLVVWLAVFIFLDFQRHLSGLILGFLLFLATYLALVNATDQVQLSAFWRDIGALALLYFAVREKVGKDPDQAEQSKLEPLGDQRGFSGDTISPKKHPRMVKSDLYRQDLDLVRFH